MMGAKRGVHLGLPISCEQGRQGKLYSLGVYFYSGNLTVQAYQ